MLENIEIKNFRAIEDLKIENFKNVNFFFGRANSAKTSVLEALHLFLKEDTSAIQDISDSRFNLVDDDVIEGLFFDYNIAQEIIISNNNKNLRIIKSDDKKTQIANGVIADVKSVTYSLKINDKELTNILFSIAKNQNIAEIQAQVIPNRKSQSAYIGLFKLNEHFYNNMKRVFQDNELENKLNKYCNDFDGEITRISVIDKAVYATILGHNKKINLKLMGQGFISYLSYITEILIETRYICIDEIENGLHFEHIDLILKIILKLSIEHNIQFFITTHSKELLERLAKIADENDDFKNKIACFNLYKEESKIKYIEYNSENFSWNIGNGNEIRD